jgi:crossover junction endodeoxyribonuclease RuvC
MILLGIDPGTTVTGFGVIRAQGNCVSWVDSGAIQTRGCADLASKLDVIYNGLTEVISRHKPDLACIEQAFYAKNVHTTLILGHARGVAMLAAKKAGAQIVEYSPREIKKAITGKGNAQKEQVAFMVQSIIIPQQRHALTDAYDALAVALCGFYNYLAQTKVYAPYRAR